MQQSALAACLATLLWTASATGQPVGSPAGPLPPVVPAPPPRAIAPIDQANPDDPPLTVVVTRFARRGCQKAFEAAWNQTFQIRRAFQGHLLTEFIRPTRPSDTGYHMIFTFDRISSYRAWEQSPERADWIQRMNALTEGAPRYQIQPGLEAWVTLPGPGGGGSPEKYRTATVTWLAIFPLVAAINAAVGPMIATAPFLVRNFVVTALVVPVMTWIVMPPMTWLFQDWLYPPAPECAG